MTLFKQITSLSEADPDIQDDDGHTALIMAASWGKQAKLMRYFEKLKTSSS